jgi:DNA-binding beta-propeller fold protein YncE
MAVDEGAGLLYVAEAAAKTVAVVSLQSGQIVDRIAVGAAPYLVALDKTRGLLYVATPGDKSIWITPLAAGAPARRVAVPGLGLTLGLTLDEKGRAYVVYAVSPRTRAIAALEVMTGEDRQVSNSALRTIIEGNYSLPLTEAAGLAVRDDRIYVTDGGNLWAIDSTSGATLGQTQIDATADTFGLAMDSAGHIIIADARGGQTLLVAPPR